MSVKSTYQAFLADQKSASLAPDASLIYVTTTTKLEGSDAILSHLSKQKSIVTTKSQDIIDAIQGPGSLFVDVETTLEFVSGGGAYLPSLDENFLFGHVVTFPMVISM